MKFAFTAALIAIALPVAGHAQDAKPKKEKKAADPNKKVCREEGETGSRFTKRVCRTAAEWAQTDADNGAAATDAMRRNRSGAN